MAPRSAEGGLGPATTRLGLDEAWRSILPSEHSRSRAGGLGPEDFGGSTQASDSPISDVGAPRRLARRLRIGSLHQRGINGVSRWPWGCGRRYRCRRYRLDRRRSGRWLRTPLRQIPISDEGRGADIGLHAIRRVLHAADQRGGPGQAVAWSEIGNCDRLCRLCDDGAAACDPGRSGRPTYCRTCS
jgi:glucosamine kinase